ncbi:phage tail tape measure protein [Clostridium perfringens]|uniref:phage tail tape measure protein n=1 Tax=Clostridium perfringens TaxID=1502 RepID=UPI00096A603F|nr:phage tail tape measure protein [Clostridium perfringens]
MGDSIERLVLELALESGNFKKQIQGIDSAIKKSENEFKNASKGVTNYENSYVGLSHKISKTSKQIDLYSQKLEKQEAEYKELSNIVDTQKAKLLELESTVGKGSEEWQKQATLLQKNAQKMLTLSTNIDKTKNTINTLEQELKDSKQQFEQLGNSTKTVAEQLTEIENKSRLAESELNKLGSEMNSNGNFFKQLGQEMKSMSLTLETNIQKIDVYEQEIKKLNSKLQENKLEHTKLSEEIKKIESALEQSKSEYGENSVEAEQLRQKLLTLKDSYSNVEKEIEDTVTDLNKYQTELNETQAEVNNLARDLKQLPFDTIGEKVKSAGQNTKQFGQSVTMGVTMPMGVAGAAATKAGVDFTTSMSALQATAGIADKSSESYKKLEEKALAMGSSTSFSASEAADGLKFLALAGWDVETSVSRIEPVLRAAEAGGIDLARTADLVTDSMSAAGVKSDDFAKYLDIVANAQRKSNTSMEQMLEAYIVAGGIFDQLNVPLEESGVLLGILANRGTKGSEAGNALISVFSNIITETGQAGKALDALNISLYTSEGKQRNIVEVLKEMATKLGVASDGTSKLTEKQKQQYAAMVGGKTQFDTLMKLLSGVSGEYDTLKSQLEQSNGSLNEMARIMKDNLGGKIESMKSAIEGSLIRAFVAMEPVLSKIVELITDVANWFSSLDEEQQKNIVTMGAIVAALGPVLMGIGNLIIVGGNAVTLFGKLGAGATATAGATGGLTSALGVLASPIGIGAVIVALTALMAMVGDNEMAILKLQEKFGGLGYIIGAVCEFISGIVQMTFGNLAISIMGICDIIAAIADGPGGQTVNDAWSRITAKLTLNTEEAMMKVTNSTSRGLSQMRAMSESELTVLTQTADGILKNIPLIVDGNYGEAANRMAHQLGALDQNQLNTLTHMNDTTKMLFQGINNSMTVEQKANQVEWNLKQMAQAGKINGDTMAKDISKAMETFTKTMEQKTKESSNKADTNTNEMSKSVADNTDNMADKVDDNASDMEKYATSNANAMKNNVTSATATMRDRCISDWRSIRNEYSRGINGNVSIMRTTTNVQRSIVEPPRSYSLEPQNYSLDNRVARAFNIPQIDSSNYMTRGSYYSSSSEESLKVNTSFVNNDFNKIVKALSQKETESKNEINLYLEKVEIKNNDDYQVVAKKLANMLNVELEKLKKKNKRTKGGGIYA